MPPRRFGAALVLCCYLFAGDGFAAPEATPDAAPTSLSLSERVRAQTAIERVYFEHREGETRSFEVAVPGSRIEAKVRGYLNATRHLAEIWDVTIDGTMLRREMERILDASQDPARLQKLFDALDDDAVLIQECLVRPVLAERLLSRRYAHDRKLHALERQRAEAILDALRTSETHRVPDAVARRRTCYAANRDEDATDDRRGTPHRATGTEDDPLRIEAERFHELRASFDGIGEPRLRETGSGFEIALLDSVSAGKMTIASWRIPKQPYDLWREDHDLPGLDRIEPAAGLTAAPFAGSFSNPAPALRGATSPASTWTWDDGPSSFVSRRFFQSVWTGTELIVWGGETWDTPGDDLYWNDGFLYDPILDAARPLPTSGAPGPLSNGSAVWTGSEMLVWGGNNLGNIINTGARFDPVFGTWTPVSTDGAPTARAYHDAVWTGSRMIVFGGIDQVLLDDGAEYDPVSDSWQPIATAPFAPNASNGFTIWTGSEMLVLDFLSTQAARYDPGSDSWASVSTLGMPSTRRDTSAVWTGSEVVVWGGRVVNTPTNAGHRYDPAGDVWSPIASAGAPAARYRHGSVWTGSEVLVWGGKNNSSARFTEGGRYDPAGDSWAPLASFVGGFLDPAAYWTGNELIVWADQLFGGRYDPAGDSWVEFSVSQLPPLVGEFVWSGSEVLAWGRVDAWPAIQDSEVVGGRYDPALDAWHATPTANAPRAEDGHVAAWTGQEMAVWGGYRSLQPIGVEILGGGSLYDPALDAWTLMPTLGAPTPRVDPSAVWTGDRLLVWGGHPECCVFDAAIYPCGDAIGDGAAFDPVADAWTPMSTMGAPGPRLGHGAVWSGTEMIVFGGYDTFHVPTAPETIQCFFAPYADGGRYDPLTDSWAPVASFGDPWQWPATVWAGSEMIVFGDESGQAPATQAGRYDPQTDSWTATPPPADSDFGDPDAVWTGAELVAWTGAETLVYEPLGDMWTIQPAVDGSIPGVRSLLWTGSSVFFVGGARQQPGVLLRACFLGEGGDDDDDGVCVDIDNCPVDANPGQEDADGDGIGDVCDPCPLSEFDDDDGDGLCGDVDNCPQTDNAGQEDGDGDGTGDACDFCPADPADDGDGDGLCADTDNCPGDANPGQEDGDGDGAGDVCDPCPADALDDGDGDGFCADLDNCPLDSNPLQTDSDSDGTGDPCDPCPLDAGDDADLDGLCADVDNCPLAANPSQADGDSDGDGDVCDNCPATANADQADGDGDGAGDVCDVCPLDPLDDGDADGVCGDVDNCPATANPAQLDTDLDGIGDACDPCPTTGLDDDDGDGICGQIDNCPATANAGQRDGDFDQWAIDAVASSEFTPTDYGAIQAAGPPESEGQCNDVETNWSPLTDTADPEFLELDYHPAPAEGVSIHESLESGFVYRVDLRDTGGTLHTVWNGADTTACGEALELTWPATAYDVASVIVHTQVAGWEEIDAVELRGNAGDGFGNACDVCPAEYDPSQTDSDGDGSGDACDCAPGDAGVRPSADVMVTMERSLNGIDHPLVWSPTAGAQTYNVFRSTLVGIRSGDFGSCPLTSSFAMAWVDPDLPAPGEAFVYVVQGISPVCGAGTLGFDSAGRDRGVHNCP